MKGPDLAQMPASPAETFAEPGRRPHGIARPALIALVLLTGLNLLNRPLISDLLLIILILLLIVISSRHSLASRSP